MITNDILKQRQNLSLAEKIEMSKERIREWYEAWDGQVYISFSGGKDSTVLLDLVRSIYSEVPAVFLNTGLEYPEILSFIKRVDNVIHIYPRMKFKDVIEKYGYPVASKETSQKINEIRNTKSDKLRNKRMYGDANKNGKVSEKWKFLIDAPFLVSHKCCYILKKNPVKRYEKESGNMPMVGTMVSDSYLRQSNYKRHGCNSFSVSRPMSLPLSFWCEKDIWNYIHKYDPPYSKIYDMGYHNTGCMFCMFGVHLQEEPNKFQLMKETHPKHWNYCINKLGCGKVLDYINIPYE